MTNIEVERILYRDIGIMLSVVEACSAATVANPIIAGIEAAKTSGAVAPGIFVAEAWINKQKGAAHREYCKAQRNHY
ncbi:MAG: hypothetical protein ACLFNU_13320 [Bacteroidales bacterium]